MDLDLIDFDFDMSFNTKNDQFGQIQINIQAKKSRLCMIYMAHNIFSKVITLINVIYWIFTAIVLDYKE